MKYEPPTNPSLWQAFLADEDGYITTVAEAFDEYGPESNVRVSIRCLSALPVPQTPGAEDGVWRLPGSSEEGHIAAEWQLEMVDDLGETDHIDRQLQAAQAMAAGLNGALANQGDWNRGTELAATLHDLADKLAVYTGPLTKYTRLSFHFVAGVFEQAEAIANADQLGLHLFGAPGKPVQVGAGWRHQSSTETAGLKAEVFASIPDPGETILLARIAELEAKLAGGAR
ncbi:hypothetical protein GCM10010112_56010 [Actinoplanes lobatus]|uniref:Uncharacterized protein n=1 Tax=Actinoplanes lobatus TaxID=113568 RepID=A0A7W7HEP4_9ACTN|nr:hypothetical protein [Actinoplanes lobatus]MBB4749181.1 hypothetical protein [Actinoplanes lobatus]GGN80449.1 hypothetical protein GCM10010112_56010 [Actinoplanes lobatus]GIE45261.1 hypothetical protein Alo02nite_81590 [Actinoplanes lobatus]